MSDSVRPHRWQPTRLPRPWDSPGKSTGVGCHFLVQCRKLKSESEVAQSCLTLSNPTDCSPPGSSVHGIFQARVQEWGAIAFSILTTAKKPNKSQQLNSSKIYKRSEITRQTAAYEIKRETCRYSESQLTRAETHKMRPPWKPVLE